jgi:hypothetical protein
VTLLEAWGAIVVFSCGKGNALGLMVAGAIAFNVLALAIAVAELLERHKRER